jgi:two-component system, NtrC family, nitrogen regulation sensor histidine kinase NtrY
MRTTVPVEKRRRGPWLLGAFVLLLLTVLVLLQTSNLWKNFAVETASDTLVIYALSSVNFIAVVVFGFIFLRSIIKLFRERRALQLGSRIKTRLLMYFAMISILPIFAMAGFSYLFMNRALERWFSQFPEAVVVEARDAQRRTVQNQIDKLQFTARMVALALENRAVDMTYLDELAEAGSLAEIRVVSSDGRLLVRGGRNEISGPEMALIVQGSFEDPALRDGKRIDAAAAPLLDGRYVVVVPDLAADEHVIEMADRALAEFDRLKQRQIVVRQVGILTLGVLTFLLIFASSWTAFYVARGLTVPVKALAEGADEIARGNLSHRVDVLAEDELAILVSAFNEMSSKMEANADELIRRRSYIETILLSLPAGVVSVDADGRVDMINPAARAILRLEEGDFAGQPIGTVIGEPDGVIFERLVVRAKRIGRASEQAKLRPDVSSAEMPAAITATALPDNSGAVIVIEDLSELIAGQRASAWREVARRMAHEIKNPLTPIQLSAERIAKRFGSQHSAMPGGTLATVGDSGGASPDDHSSKVVLDGTSTILREVQSLKSMVDEFSRFARLPEARLEPGDVNRIVNQAAALYEDRSPGASIQLNLADKLPPVMLDEEQLKRVFVNLIDNAIEAPNQNGTPRVVTITTRHDNAGDIVVAEVADNGGGIDPADHQNLFQPYFSTKGRGTGLGLAIVHRIILEHGGKIVAGHNRPTGARFTIEFPVSS